MNPKYMPERAPDVVRESGLKIWFEEMICYTQITTKDDFHLCNLVLTTTERHLAVVVPDGWYPRGLMLFLVVEPRDVMPFSDELNDAYWKWVGEKILLEE